MRINEADVVFFFYVFVGSIILIPILVVLSMFGIETTLLFCGIGIGAFLALKVAITIEEEDVGR